MVSAFTGAAAYSSRDVLPPFPPISGSQPSRGSEVVLAFSTPTEPGRVYWDVPLAGGMREGETSLELEAELSSESLLAGMTLHLRCGGTWYTARIREPRSVRGRATVPLARFRGDSGQSCDPSEADRLRLSVWLSSPKASGVLKLYGLRALRDVVAIATTGDEKALERTRTLFEVAGIPYAEIGDDFTEARGFRLVVIPEMTDATEEHEAKNIQKASRDGTAFMVFYTDSQLISTVTGIRPGSWHHVEPESAWTAMLPDAKRMGGFSARVPHETNNLIPPYEGEGAAAVAWCADEVGAPMRLPACVVSERGAWFSHIPPLPTRPAVELTRRICLRFVPELAEVFAVNALMENAELIEAVPSPSGKIVEAIKTVVEKRSGIEQIPQLCSDLRDAGAGKLQRTSPAASNEVHGVWDPRASSRSLASWKKTAAKLQGNGINTVFALAQIGWEPLFAPNVPEPLKAPLERYAVEAAGVSVEVHAWMYTLCLEGYAKNKKDRLEAEQRLMVSADGRTLPWLCPVNAENRALLVAGAVNLARTGVSGVHLDYIRHPETGGCFCGESRKAFERKTGAKVKQWPTDVTGDGELAEQYHAFQTENLTELVGEISRAVRGVRKGIRVSAAVYPEADSAAKLCQDWPTWLSTGLVDFICPMTYASDENRFSTQMDRIFAACLGREGAIVAGIGTTASEPGPDAYGAARQIVACRRRGGGGFAFFYLDDMLIDSILPALTLGK